jgi:DNA ligase (NAD+)
VVVTGAMPEHSRDGAQEAVIAAGGKPASSVSKKTDYVVVGPGAGSKATKAADLGIPVIEADDFSRFLAEGPSILE